MEDVFRFRVKRPKRKPRKYIKPKDDVDRKMVYIVRKIARGDYDPENKSDVIQARIARYKGIIDDNQNILKEEYLLCKTKRKF